MPGYAYQWLTPSQKKLRSLGISYTTKYISVGINEITRIWYKDVAGDTEVRIERIGKDMIVANRTFLDVCCEDLALLWKNRDEKQHLELRCYAEGDNCDTIRSLEAVRERLFGFIENLLNTGKKPLKISSLSMDSVDIGQTIKKIQSFHPKVLFFIALGFKFQEDPRVDIGELLKLKDWNRGRRLIVRVVLQVLTAANLVTLRNLEQYTSTFQEFDVAFKSKDEDCDLEILPDFLKICRYATPWRSIAINANKWPPRLDEEGDSDDSDEEIEQFVEQNNSACFSWLKVLANRDIMEFITQELDYFNIQCLRETCSKIRKCVDIVNPDPRVSEYMLGILGPYNVFGKITFTNENYEYGMVNVPNHLNVYLKRQKKCLDVLSIEAFSHDVEGCPFVLDIIKNHLKSMGSWRVRKLKLGRLSQNNIMQILPFIDAEKIETYHFCLPLYEKNELEIDQICKTDTWTKAEEVCLSSTLVSTLIQEIPIDHFTKCEIRLKTISSEDILYLKNKLLTSQNFQKYKFLYSNIINEENLHSLIGEPYRNLNNVRKIWYFYFEGSDDYMHLVLDARNSWDEYGIPNFKSIVFTRVAKEDTPFF